MKSKPKNKGKPYVPQQKKRKLTNVPVEVQFAQKLAANDPVTRDRAVKKLKKWLKARNKTSVFSEDEMLRLWKGLHYCFWMSDKPLVQEELAESISSLIHCFDANWKDAHNFITAGLVTEGREWIGIDRWRMDKFMMFVRRLMRQIFVVLAKSKWSTDKVVEVAEIFRKNVISNDGSALGFRLHFIDAYLEEVAKIGGDDLAEEPIFELVRPFALEIAEGKEERLVDHIEERIYQHLMRQSDLGKTNFRDVFFWF